MISTDAKLYSKLRSKSAKLRWLGIMKRKNSLNQPVLVWIKEEEERLGVDKS